MERSDHVELHKELNEHLDNYINTKGETYKTNGNLKTMKPTRGNSGARIRQNFTPQERQKAMADFYKGGGSKYTDAAAHFFGQHPHLK